MDTRLALCQERAQSSGCAGRHVPSKPLPSPFSANCSRQASASGPDCAAPPSRHTCHHTGYFSSGAICQEECRIGAFYLFRFVVIVRQANSLDQIMGFCVAQLTSNAPVASRLAPQQLSGASPLAMSTACQHAFHVPALRGSVLN